MGPERRRTAGPAASEEVISGAGESISVGGAGAAGDNTGPGERGVSAVEQSVHGVLYIGAVCGPAVLLLTERPHGGRRRVHGHGLAAGRGRDVLPDSGGRVLYAPRGGQVSDGFRVAQLAGFRKGRACHRPTPHCRSLPPNRLPR